VIAVVEGAALGGGFGLTCISDVAIARADAQFGMPETRLGIIPAQIAPFVVQRIGLTQARRLALLGLRLNGAQAAQIGLVHEVCADADTLEAALQRTLDDINQCAPDANRVTKALLLKVGHQPLDSLLDDAADAFAAAIQSAEGMEGGMAFIQKRPANWVQ
jgi:isohexenylglutaconyl-CoA hydratase